MLFNSFAFVVVFLPVVWSGFFLLGRRWPAAAAAWLVIASLVFYGWERPVLIALLLGSGLMNFVFGRAIVATDRPRRRRLLAIAAITADLAVLGYFKYANFFLDNLDALSGLGLAFDKVALPLGISFFTFTQIAFIADVYAGQAKAFGLTHYLLFISYFPHLIAGPILHHREMMPQFAKATTYRPDWKNQFSGLVLFLIGLCKKVILADSMAGYVDPIFNAADHGHAFGLFVSWTGALAYTLQIYFDFSAYSDMAVGVSRMFNIELPLNFASPYRSLSIVEFWRRWHMTLSRFLRDYLYIPLGGNRRGEVRRYLNLFATMLLGGLWHGASWTFVAWGGLHGLYLSLNHAADAVGRRFGVRPSPGLKAVSFVLTFAGVVAAWVIFRAATFQGGASMWAGMVGLHGMEPSVGEFGAALSRALNADQTPARAAFWVVAGLALCWLAPNSQTVTGMITARLKSARALAAGAALVLIAVLLAINLSRGESEFIYFNF